MKQEDGYIETNKGQSIYYQVWLPEGKVKAAVFVVHGLHEHSGRYHHLANFLVDQKLAVYSLDFPGHGKSDGIRSFVDSLQDFIDPIISYLKMIKSWQPGVPIFMLGHSMGGLLTMAFLAEHPGLVAGAIISAALVKVPDYVSDLVIRIGKILAAILPKVRLIEIDKAGLSRDPAVVQAYIDDPLVFNGKATARISNEINYGISLIAERGSLITEPVLLLHGGKDRICDPSWSQYLHDLVSSPDKELIIYEGLYHEIFNEPEADTVFKDVINWLETRID